MTGIKKSLYLILLLLMVVGSFMAGSWHNQRRASQKVEAGGRRILYYVDPMNPAHTSPEPGLAPCGMKMEPVYEDGGEKLPMESMPPGTVKISPEKQQMVGVRVERVEKAPWKHIIRTSGRVAVDETRVYRVNAYTEGWILKAHPYTTGSLVMKDDILASFYSRDFLTAEQAYFYALNTVDRIKKGDEPVSGQQTLTNYQVRSAEENLLNLGMTRQQMEEIARTRQASQEILVAAPATGFILTRNVSAGLKFDKGTELYKLADLSRVWVLADLVESESGFIRAGETVLVSLPHEQGKYSTVVSEVLPEFDPVSRTLKVRLVADNPNYALRPEMFVDVEFPINLPAAVTVPVDAVLDSGNKKTVFVARGNGFFEPRQVETGWHHGDRVEIVQGLAPGETIAVSGTFLIDSESRMKLAAMGMYGKVTKDPVCGMDVDEGKAEAAGLRSEHGGKIHHFCSDQCKRKFEADPGAFLQDGGKTGSEEKPAATSQTEEIKDPVCGMAVDPAKAKEAGLRSDYLGKTHFFCSSQCKQAFDANPGAVAKKEDGAVASSKPAATPQTGEIKDPVCGMAVDPANAKQAGLWSDYLGTTCFFCSKPCKLRFDADPGAFLKKDGAGGNAEKATATGKVKEVKDPVCGMAVDPVGAKQAGLWSNYLGTTYFFCSKPCKRQFDTDPELELEKAYTAGHVDAALEHPQMGENAETPAEMTEEEEIDEATEGEDSTTVTDPVCGMLVEPDHARDAGLQTQYLGKIHSFCCAECKGKFDSNPEFYIEKANGHASSDRPTQSEGTNGGRHQHD